MLKYFATGPDRTPIADAAEVKRLLKHYLKHPLLWVFGLTAIDLLPVRAAGAVKGVIGLFSYIGAAIASILLAMIAWNAKPRA